MAHEHFMQRCLDLALNGEGTTSPNPMVGCVIVHNGKIIGEGWHKKAGEPHAEVNAIASVKNHALLPQSTLYVSLEPCSHHGRTPPCASLICEKKIPRVVVACLDPNPQVSGNGITVLRNAGIDVTVGVLEAEALAVNKTFITYHKSKRCYITLKWAQSRDGFMDIVRHDSQRGSFALSGDVTKTWVHKMRALHDAILVGPNTAQTDDPALTVREFSGKSPIRLVIDRNNRLPKTLKVFADGGKTIHFVRKKNRDYGGQVEIAGENFLADVFSYCYTQGIQSIFIEGGADILNVCLQNNMWDEAVVIQSAKTLKNGLKAPVPSGLMQVQQTLGSDIVISYLRHDLPRA